MRLPGLRLTAAVIAGPAGLLLGGCGLEVLPSTTGSGRVVEASREVGSFTEFSVGSAFNVTVRVGDEYALRLRADDNVMDEVKAGVRNDRLYLDLDTDVRDVTLEAEVTVPKGSLSGLYLSGAATLTATDHIAAPDLEVRAIGASRVHVVVEATDLDVVGAAAAVVNLSGTATRVAAEADGAATLQLVRLEAESAQVQAGGASTVEVNVTQSLTADASGASTIRYTGNPRTVDVQTDAASSVDEVP